MTSNDNYNPIIMQYRDVAIDMVESLKVYDKRVILSEIPDTFYGVTIDGYSEVKQNVYGDPPTLTSSQFYVDYRMGVVNFHSSIANNINVTARYKGRGIVQYPAERIYYQNENGIIKDFDQLGKEIDAMQVVTNQSTTLINNVNTAISNSTTQTNYAKAQGDYAKSVGDSSKMIYKSPVATFSAIASTYPSPQLGWIVQCIDTNDWYRHDGTSWVKYQNYNSTGFVTQSELTEQTKQTVNLVQGSQIVSSNQDSILDIELSGRTLANRLGQKELHPTLNYVYIPNKGTTKIDYNGTKIETLTKFKGSDYIVQSITNDFVGKVVGSLTENPHVYKRIGASALQPPSSFSIEGSSLGYTNIQSLNGVIANDQVNANTQITQQLFSFDLIQLLERQYSVDIWNGRTSLADKVSIAKQIVTNLAVEWYGYGTSATGNKATVQLTSNGSTWDAATATSTTSGTIAKVTVGTASTARIDSNGIFHVIAFAEPSDGVTASAINTDYIKLVVTTNYIKPIKYTLKSDFRNKVTSSTIENGNIFKGNANASDLSPSSYTFEHTQANLDRIKTLDGTLFGDVTTINGAKIHSLFSFNVLRILEDKYGVGVWNGKTLLADKVAIAKSVTTLLNLVWRGYGSAPSGNGATWTFWNANSGTWASGASHSNGTVTRLDHPIKSTNGTSTPTNCIDANGFLHGMAMANASDGVTGSTIWTDYVELEVETSLNLPILGDSLYEIITTTEWDKINVDPEYSGTKLTDKFPYVEGVKHLKNPIIAAEGDNLIQLFTEGAWTLGGTGVINYTPTLLELTPSATFYQYYTDIKLIPNQSYTLSCIHTGKIAIQRFVTSTQSWLTFQAYTTSQTINFTVPSDTEGQCRVIFGTETLPTSVKYTFSNPMLVIGSSAKPFVPRNPTYLYADVELAGSHIYNDQMYYDNGDWKVRRMMARDIPLDATSGLGWSLSPNPNDFVGFKRFICNTLPNTNSTSAYYYITKHTGQVLGNYGQWVAPDQSYLFNGGASVTVSDLETGFAEAYTPTNTEVAAYFNGWKVKTVDGANKPTAWVSVVDGTDAPTQTLAYVSTNKATGYTPYKASYVLATPYIETVSGRVEGALNVQGSTQVTVDSGVVVREKANPMLDTTFYYIQPKQASIYWNSAKVKYNVKDFIKVFKNGTLDTNWKYISNQVVLQIPQGQFDPIAEYTVTYLVLDKHLFTSNPDFVKATYDSSFKSVVSNVLDKQADNASTISVHTKMLIDILARLKAGGIA